MTQKISLGRGVITIGILFLFIAYQLVVIHYTHIHVLDRFLVVHVHPFSNSQESHSHTQQEFAFLDTLLLRAALIFCLFSSLLIALPFLGKIIPFTVDRVRCFLQNIFFYRGPPIGLQV